MRWVRWGVFAAACAFLYLRLAGHQGMHPGEAGLHGLTMAWPALAVALALMPLNWTLEAVKWRLLVRGLEPMPTARALAATLCGTTIGLITPNRVGEFAGRVLFLPPEHRVEGGFITVLGSIAQFVVTLFSGGIALAVGGATMLRGLVPDAVGLVVLWSALLIGTGAVVLYLSPALLARLLLGVPLLRRFEREAHALDRVPPRTLRVVLGLSAARYVVFTVQFAGLAWQMAGTPPVAALLAVPVVFLVTTLVPTTALTELGVRGSAAAAFIPGDPAAIVPVSALLWVINLVLPALVGGVVLLVARIRTTREEP
ncbi:MAG: flippase-like domain-containing protein [Flavobacteriales bacterium]|nr:flippase-like domain-containing protein [Flavobacteriales bacterium]